jgi:Tannase and feruloyl esterase/3HB-oligomer hydrolase (3HBOH)
MRRLTVACLVSALFGPAPVAGAQAATCPNAERVEVPGAEFEERACLDDITTAGTERTGHTNRADWDGLHAAGTVNPTGVPGLQVDGYFPDTSRTNTNRGRNHDSQFVIRFPNEWNGKLVITGAPGVRRQYANDFIISDWVVARGYAFTATDKGNTGVLFYRDGYEPGDAVAEWHRRVTQLTRAAKRAAALRYGRYPARTYMTGISNGGYLTRYAVERNGSLYDGAVDWEGTMFRADGPNLLTFLPPALRNYARYKVGDEAARQAILAAGFAPGSEFLWDDHYAIYWDLTQRIYREEFDPAYDGPLEAGVAFCQPAVIPGCDADYDYASRPASVREAVARVANTGRIGTRMISLHGALDTLLPPALQGEPYAGLVRSAGRGSRHRYYAVEAGNHVDSFYDRYPDRLRPILPCYRRAFIQMEAWVERGVAPPPSGTIPKGSGDLVNSCP